MKEVDSFSGGHTRAVRSALYRPTKNPTINSSGMAAKAKIKIGFIESPV
jgi:hypothetical protein